MSKESTAALIGVAVYFAMHFIDALIPRGRHFKFIDRWMSDDEDEEEK